MAGNTFEGKNKVWAILENTHLTASESNSTTGLSITPRAWSCWENMSSKGGFLNNSLVGQDLYTNGSAFKSWTLHGWKGVKQWGSGKKGSYCRWTLSGCSSSSFFSSLASSLLYPTLYLPLPSLSAPLSTLLTSFSASASICLGFYFSFCPSTFFRSSIKVQGVLYSNLPGIQERTFQPWTVQCLYGPGSQHSWSVTHHSV